MARLPVNFSERSGIHHNLRQCRRIAVGFALGENVSGLVTCNQPVSDFVNGDFHG